MPIFKGKSKASYFQPIIDKIKVKLASWKASLLTFAGRLQLVKSVVHNMLIYSITIYSWPSSLIKELEKYFRNFIWSGDLYSKKQVIVAWKTVCTPIEEGGLGIRSLSKLNEATNLKLCWEMLDSDRQWATFLRSRVLRGNKFIGYHIFSSVWSGIKAQAYHVLNSFRWLLGDGHKINFWTDDWCGPPLVTLLQIPHNLHNNLHSKVQDFIFNRHWNVPMELQVAYPTLMHHISKITIPWRPKDDKFIWKDSPSGHLSLKDAYIFHCIPNNKKDLSKLIWNSAIPPSKSFHVWRMIHNKMPTDENLHLRGLSFPSMCNLCGKKSETSKHLFL